MTLIWVESDEDQASNEEDGVIAFPIQEKSVIY